MGAKGMKVGVIGLGLMGIRHALVYDKMPLVCVHSICDANDARLEQYGSVLGAKKYSDYHEMLQDEELDAVSICLPDNMHKGAIEEALRCRKHILVEKPITSKLEEAREILDLAKGYDKVFTVGHILRFDPRYAQVHAYMRDGQLGEVVQAYCRRNSPVLGPLHYVGFSDLSMHVMIHDIDAMNYILGAAPKKVFAKARSVVLKQYDMTDGIFALVEYEGGAMVCFEACWVLPKNCPTSIDDKLEIIGTKGTAYIDSCDCGVNLVSEEKIDYPDSRHWPDINDGIGGALYEELTSFINCAIDGKPPVVSIQSAVEALEVVDAIGRSIKEGREVEL